MSVYQPNNEPADESRSSEHDDYVLRRLMKKSGELADGSPHVFIYYFVSLFVQYMLHTKYRKQTNTSSMETNTVQEA